MQLMRWRSPAAFGRALFAGCLLLAAAAFAIGGSPEEIPLNASDGVSQAVLVDDTILYGSSIDGVHRVCPQAANESRQPFCRHFSSPMVGACGSGDEIYLVLANGDLHHVNGALIGTHGGFDPVFHPHQAIELHSAWMPEQRCKLSSGLPEVLAMNGQGSLMYFNGESWRPIGVVITSFNRK